MGTLAARGASLLVAATLVVFLPASAEGSPGAAQASGAAAPSRVPTIQGGHDGRSAWMVARYRQLQVSKQFDSASQTVAIELRAGNDVVQFSVTPAGTAITRHGQTLALDSPEAIESLQQLLGGSMAVFATREMLSQLEADSALEAPDMALLSTAAFVASLVGDPSAPRRLADRFVAKHRGIFRQVGGGGRATCWQEYTVELTHAWDELEDCMDEAEDDLWWWAPIRRLACNGVWLMRSESAWFEYLKCISPMSTLQP
jgi:hypothetical protein